MAYKPGDVIMKCKPFVHILCDSQKSIRCDFCFQLKESLKKCGNCKQMYYCDKICQKLDWSECHKNECKIFMNITVNKHFNDSVRFLLRLWLLHKFNPERKCQTYELHNGLKRSFDDLMTHSNELREDTEVIAYFYVICHQFELCDIDYDWDELFEMMCKINVNSITIADTDIISEMLGQAIYITGSALNHSCAPNTSAIFNGIDMEVRAIKPISIGEEVYTEYIHLIRDRNQRKTILREQYYFDCKCLKCSTHLDSDFDYNLLLNLQKELLTLIDGQNDWHKCYLIGLKTIGLLNKIFGDFHCLITVQMIRVLRCKREDILVNEIRLDRANLAELKQLIDKTKEAIKVTHGFQHPIYETFQKMSFTYMLNTKDNTGIRIDIA